MGLLKAGHITLRHDRAPPLTSRRGQVIQILRALTPFGDTRLEFRLFPQFSQATLSPCFSRRHILSSDHGLPCFLYPFYSNFYLAIATMDRYGAEF